MCAQAASDAASRWERTIALAARAPLPGKRRVGTKKTGHLRQTLPLGTPLQAVSVMKLQARKMGLVLPAWLLHAARRPRHTRLTPLAQTATTAMLQAKQVELGAECTCS